MLQRHALHIDQDCGLVSFVEQFTLLPIPFTFNKLSRLQLARPISFKLNLMQSLLEYLPSLKVLVWNQLSSLALLVPNSPFYQRCQG